MNRHKLIIFDLDGTLINSLPYHSLAFKDLLLEHNIRINDSHLRKLIGMPTRNILEELKKKHKFRENIQDLREERRYHYFKFLGKRDIVFPGVKALLKDLRLRYKLAVATGSSKIIFSHSTDKDFQEMFDYVVTINDVRRGKPNPEQLLLAARKARVKPEQCLMIGDSIYDGIAAQKAGMNFIGVSTGYHNTNSLMVHHAMKVLSSITELRKVLK